MYVCVCAPPPVPKAFFLVLRVSATSTKPHLLDQFFQCTAAHFTGTVSNEATSEMGYPAWPAGRTCKPFYCVCVCVRVCV